MLDWIQSTAICSLALLHCIKTLKNGKQVHGWLTPTVLYCRLKIKRTWGCLGAFIGLVDLLCFCCIRFLSPSKNNGIFVKRCSNPIYCTGESLRTAVMDPWWGSWGMTHSFWVMCLDSVHPHLAFPVSFTTLVCERPMFYRPSIGVIVQIYLWMHIHI